MSQPSIFNDVLGPVMRGPSSSHTAASWRIGTLALDLLKEPLESALVEFDELGAWAPNYREQGTVLGMDGGLLGVDITDERIRDTDAIAEERNITISYEISRFPTDHPNTVRLTLHGISGRRLVLVAVSLGGGMFETRMINGHAIRMQGDYYELIGYTKADANIQDKLSPFIHDGIMPSWSSNMLSTCFHLRQPVPFSPKTLDKINAIEGVKTLTTAKPILPIISGLEKPLPFTTYQELLEFNDSHEMSLGDLGLLYESCRSGQTELDVTLHMNQLVDLIEASIKTGLSGTSFSDRILHQQSHLIAESEAKSLLPSDSLVNRIIENVTAIMEAKSAMEVIVAAPTAGGCGTLGGTIKAVTDARETSNDAKIRSYFAAGLIGVFFAMGPGFSAEAGGCQLETGAAASMAAAALTDLCGGSAVQSLSAASMALQNTIGLVCDPVADRVEVPCLGKNVTAGVNALAASTMALSGFNAVIPLDEVIETVKSVAASMPRSLCCTGLGGLAATPTSQKLKQELQAGCSSC